MWRRYEPTNQHDYWVHPTMLAVFLISVLFILYTYALFPIYLHVKAKRKDPVECAQPEEWPTVSVLIAAHNEANNLPAKLKTLSELDYPKELIEWIIVSDGSTDGSVELLEKAFADYPNRHVHHLETALGKCGALNAGVLKASGDIIVFMDTRQRISSNTIKKLVPFLANPEIGAVSGELVLANDDTLEAENFGLYWRYEKWIRDNESRLFSTTGATGALYAIRREDFIPNKLGTILDDFETPLSLLKQGKRTLFVQGAYAYDKVSSDLKHEFARKVRTNSGSWQTFHNNPWLFSPSKNPVWWQFLSHRLFRQLVPFAMILAFLSAAIGQGPFLNTMLVLQIVFYAVAAASYFQLPGTGNKLFNIIVVFLQLNMAAFIACIKFIFVRKEIKW